MLNKLHQTTRKCVACGEHKDIGEFSVYNRVDNRPGRTARSAVSSRCTSCERLRINIRREQGMLGNSNKVVPIMARHTSQITEEVVDVTPEIAAAWLERNTVNRPLRRFVVDRYAADMSAGRWKMSPDNIIAFDADGNLIGGQHRLHAVIKSGFTMRCRASYGWSDPDLKHVLNSGSPVSAGDVLDANGVANAARVASALRALAQFRDARTTNYIASNSEVAQLYQRHPGISKAVARTHGLPKGANLAGFAALFYCASIMGKDEEVERAVQVFRTGIPSYEGDAIHAFRERLLKLNGMQVNKFHQFYTLIFAWNKFVKRTPAQLIKWMKDFQEIEGFDRDMLK